MIWPDVVAARGLEVVLIGAAIDGRRARVPALGFFDTLIALGTRVWLGGMSCGSGSRGMSVLFFGDDAPR
jgi:hypothetical protein